MTPRTPGRTAGLDNRWTTRSPLISRIDEITTNAGVRSGVRRFTKLGPDPVRDPGCPQAPVPAGARRLPALMRGCSCGWLRPRPPIPGQAAFPGQAARHVANHPVTKRSAPGPGSPTRSQGPRSRERVPGTGRTSQIPPVLVKASLPPGSLKTWIWKAGPAVWRKGSMRPPGAASGDLLICPLGCCASPCGRRPCGPPRTPGTPAAPGSSKRGQARACPGQARAHQGQPVLAMITTTEVSTV